MIVDVVFFWLGEMVGKFVLDIGCGIGCNIVKLVNYCDEVIGMDLVLGMVS